MNTYTLKIYQDTGAENPWNAWDCQAPLFTEWSREYNEWQYNLNVSMLIDLLPKSKLNKNILKLFWLDDTENYPIMRIDYKSKADFVSDSLREHVENTVENIEALANILKLPTYSWTSRGSCQWDCINCVLVMTPAWIKEVGIDTRDSQKMIEDLKNESKTFDSWAWWNVYLYSLIENIPLYHEDKTISTETEENIIDSCSWFYGDDWLNQILESIPETHKHLFEKAKENIIYPRY